jgi:hypothetical protein
MDYKTKVLEELEGMPETRVRIVIDFIEYIKDKEAWRSTREILSDKKMMRQIQEADKALKAKQMHKFISWEKIKK